MMNRPLAPLTERLLLIAAIAGLVSAGMLVANSQSVVNPDTEVANQDRASDG